LSLAGSSLGTAGSHQHRVGDQRAVRLADRSARIHASPIRAHGGLIFGYATVSEHAIAEGIQILARVIVE